MLFYSWKVRFFTYKDANSSLWPCFLRHIPPAYNTDQEWLHRKATASKSRFFVFHIIISMSIYSHASSESRRIRSIILLMMMSNGRLLNSEVCQVFRSFYRGQDYFFTYITSANKGAAWSLVLILFVSRIDSGFTKLQK